MDEYVSREELRRQACCIYSYGGARYVSLAVIEKMATADVAPVVHGNWCWITENIYRCDNCGEMTYVKEVMGEPGWTYCPNCGAKMDKEA